MVGVVKKLQLGWFGDGGLGEQLIGSILSGRKTATTCPAYDPGDVEVRVGDHIEVTDKHGKVRGTLAVTRIEFRAWGAFDEALASCEGTTLAELRENVKLGNARDIKSDEEMRIVHFELLKGRR